MVQFTLDLDYKQERPVIMLANGLTALLDTGAYIPIWTDDEDALKSLKDVEFIKGGVPISGFGGTTEGNLYQATIEIGKLIFPKMHIVANNELKTPFNMILSATMFHDLAYEINTKTHKFSVAAFSIADTVRDLKIKDKNGKLHVLCGSAIHPP